MVSEKSKGPPPFILMEYLQNFAGKSVEAAGHMAIGIQNFIASQVEKLMIRKPVEKKRIAPPLP